MKLAPCPYALSCPTPIRISQNFSHPLRGWCLWEKGWGGCDTFKTPVGEVPTKQSHPVLHVALEQQGERFKTSFHSGRSLTPST